MTLHPVKKTTKPLPPELENIHLHQIAHAIWPSVHRRLEALGVQTAADIPQITTEKYLAAPIRTAVSLREFERVKFLAEEQPWELAKIAARSDMVWFPAKASFRPSFDWLEKAVFFLLDRDVAFRRNDLNREVILRRYGFLDGRRLVLDAIGAPRHLTRERIRQAQRTTLEELGRFLAGEYRRDTRAMLREPLAEFFHETAACILADDLVPKTALTDRLAERFGFDATRHAAIGALLLDGLGLKELLIGEQALVFNPERIDKHALQGSVALIVRALRQAREPLGEKALRAAWRASVAPVLAWETTRKLCLMLDCVGRTRSGAEMRYELLFDVSTGHFLM
jgi:hypothetical protein